MKPKHFSLRPLVVSLGACGILFSGSGIHAQEVSTEDDGAIRATSDMVRSVQRVTTEPFAPPAMTAAAAPA